MDPTSLSLSFFFFLLAAAPTCSLPPSTYVFSLSLSSLSLLFSLLPSRCLADDAPLHCLFLFFLLPLQPHLALPDWACCRAVRSPLFEAAAVRPPLPLTAHHLCLSPLVCRLLPRPHEPRGPRPIPSLLLRRRHSTSSSAAGLSPPPSLPYTSLSSCSPAAPPPACLNPRPSSSCRTLTPSSVRPRCASQPPDLSSRFPCRRASPELRHDQPPEQPRPP